MYGADPLYHWMGLDSPLMYAAHKASGGMTSVYRQLGTGCERLFRAVVANGMGLDKSQLDWGYTIEKADGTTRRLTLDARIDLTHIADRSRTSAAKQWVQRACRSLELDRKRTSEINGAVFEVRQGYKSADAKRQNADLTNAVRAFAADYLPVIAVLSTQISDTLLRRYRNSQILVLTGDRTDDDLSDTFAFTDRVVGYSLSDFFQRNTERLRDEVNGILTALLTPE